MQREIVACVYVRACVNVSSWFLVLKQVSWKHEIKHSLYQRPLYNSLSGKGVGSVSEVGGMQLIKHV